MPTVLLFNVVVAASIAASPVHAQVATEALLPQHAASFLARARRPYPLDLGGHVKAAVVGGAVIGLLGAAVGDGLCHFDDPCHHPAPFVIGGFVVGAAVGAAIAVRIATWHGSSVRLEVALHAWGALPMRR
jgi:hypothetical protein